MTTCGICSGNHHETRCDQLTPDRAPDVSTWAQRARDAIAANKRTDETEGQDSVPEATD